MAGLYGIKDIRHISAAYHNRYNKGLKHPDRIMNEHDFVYLLNGRWEIWQDDTAHHLIPGDVIALHAGLHHYGIQPCSDYTETIYIHAERLDCDRYLKNGMSAESLDALPLDTVIHCQGVSEIESLFHEIAFLHSSTISLPDTGNLTDVSFSVMPFVLLQPKCGEIGQPLGEKLACQ